MSGLLPGEFTETTVTELVRSDRQPSQQDTTHRELAIEAETGKIWQEGCGDFETGRALGGARSVGRAAAARARPARSTSTSTAGRTTIRPGRRRTVPGSSYWTGREDELNGTLRVPVPRARSTRRSRRPRSARRARSRPRRRRRHRRPRPRRHRRRRRRPPPTPPRAPSPTPTALRPDADTHPRRRRPTPQRP